jgi:small subunit ribosomal protein S1
LTPTTAQEPETLTMEDLLREDQNSIRALAHGDIVDGVVVRVDPDEVLVDIGAKSEGIISNRELSARGEQPVTLNSGDQVKVYIIQPEDEHGNVVLSLRKARAEGIWQAVAEKESEGEILDAEVREQNKGGLIVNIMGLRGFLPSSQVARQFSGNLMELVGTKIPVKILEVNRKRNRLIVSQRAAQDEDRARLREELFEKLKVGDVITGKVSGVTSYGAFVNLGGADGLIHISELSWDRINNVSDVLTVGDELSVKVIKLDPELSRISLSLRQMSQDPWDTIENQFPPGKAVPGIVTKTKKYGAFLQIADGVEGLLHISELSWDHVERTEDVLKVGEEVEVMVLSADKVRRRISLSLRQLHEGGPTGEGMEITPPSYDYPEEDDDDGDHTVVTAVTPMARALTDANVEGTTRAGVGEAVVAGTATAEEIAEDNAEADDDAATDRFDDLPADEAGADDEVAADEEAEVDADVEDHDDDVESELEAEVEEAADADTAAAETPAAAPGATPAATAADSTEAAAAEPKA